MIFNAATLARGWLAVATASGKDGARPQLDRTIHIEAHPHGIRLVATDSYMLLHTWIPTLDEDDLLAQAPDPDEAPTATAVVIDQHGRAKSLCAHLLTLDREAGDDAPPIEARLTLNTLVPAQQAAPAFDGMEALHVTIELPDAEKLILDTYEGAFPSWRSTLAGFAPTSTATLGLNPDLLARVVKAAKVNGHTIAWTFGGPAKAARVHLVDSHPEVEGLVMPVRWDFDADAPRVDDTDTEPAETSR